MMAGRVDVYFSPITPAMSLIREGKLLALAVERQTFRRPAKRAHDDRSRYANSDFDFWVGMFVPKRTPRNIVNRIHQETVKGLEDRAVHENS